MRANHGAVTNHRHGKINANGRAYAIRAFPNALVDTLYARMQIAHACPPILIEHAIDKRLDFFERVAIDLHLYKEYFPVVERKKKWFWFPNFPTHGPIDSSEPAITPEDKPETSGKCLA